MNLNKLHGRFETPASLAQMLVSKALKAHHSNDKHPYGRVLDPAVGNGTLVCAYLRASKISEHTNVVCIDISKRALEKARKRITRIIDPKKCLFIKEDFIRIQPDRLGSFNMILANPPFIRHHLLGRLKRTWQNLLIEQFGKTAYISLKASSWAYFMLKCHLLLEENGTMGFILPREFLFSSYGEKIRTLLADEYRNIDIYLFSDYLFEGTKISPILVITSQKCKGPAILSLHVVETDGRNKTIIGENNKKWHHIAIDKHVFAILRRIKEFLPLRNFAETRIGVVTGCNNFFVLSEKEREEFGIEKKYLYPCVSRNASLTGLVYSKEDWRRDLTNWTKCYILNIHPDTHIDSDGLKEYLKIGLSRGINKRYHSNRRKRWFSLDITVPDMFLTYINHNSPKLVLDTARATSTNTIHQVFLKRHLAEKEVKALIVSFYSSVSQLSSEIEGRPYGGGCLKLEPSDSSRILVLNVVSPSSDIIVSELACLWENLNNLLRNRAFDKVSEIVDKVLLEHSILPKDDLAKIQKTKAIIRKIRRIH